MKRVSKLSIRPLVLLCLSLFFLSCEKDPLIETGPTNSEVLQQMLEIGQEHSINKYLIDWDVVEMEAMSILNSDGFDAAVYYFLGELGDNHSFFETTSGVRIFNSEVQCEGELITVNYNAPDIAYIRVGGFSGSNAEGNAFARAIQDEIIEKDTSTLIGWIVDLRGNTGGNMYPMISGLGPILGEGVLGYFLDADEKTTAWGYANGGTYYGNSNAPLYAIDDPYELAVPNPKVAVLTDGRTASSGEAVAISFRERPNTRSFGRASCGLSTGNRGFQLYTGEHLVLTSSIMQDREGVTYGGQVVPDETIELNSDVLPRAIEWLRE